MKATEMWESERVAAAISGDQLVDARNRAGLTQPQLAQMLNTSVRTIQKWEKEGVASGKEARVQAALGPFLSSNFNVPLEELSNWALIMELGRRLGLGNDPTLNTPGSPLSPVQPPSLHANPGGSFSGRRGSRKPPQDQGK